MADRDYEDEPRGGSGLGTAISCLLVGLGAGALLGLMYAPKEGRYFRKELRSKYGDALETFEDLREEAMELAEKALARGSKMADDLRERVRM